MKLQSVKHVAAFLGHPVQTKSDEVDKEHKKGTAFSD